jgi:hypothetical protein
MVADEHILILLQSPASGRLWPDEQSRQPLHKYLGVRCMLVGKTISALHFSFLLNSFRGKKNHFDTDR